MERYAVIGQPVAHSRSPGIHRLFAEQGGAALVYEAIEIAPAALAESLERLHAEGYAGLNVTVPHKRAVAPLCVSASTAASLAGSVNTLVRTPAGWHGDNTDGTGLIADLRRLGVVVAGKRILILGAGGAARGIVAPLLAEAPLRLTVSNRNPWKPEEIAEAFRSRGPVVPRTHLSLKGDHFDLVVNATSAGHRGELPRLPPQLLAAGGVAYDLNYGAAAQPFLEWAATQSAGQASDGLGMLVEQAAAAFALWRGTAPRTAPVLQALRHPAA